MGSSVFCFSVPPRIVHHSGDVVVEENDTVSLTCRVTGVPPPTVTWYRMPSDITSTREKERKLKQPCNMTHKKKQQISVCSGSLCRINCYLHLTCRMWNIRNLQISHVSRACSMSCHRDKSDWRDAGAGERDASL